MRLSDIVNGPWAITLPMFSEVQGIYARHMRGDKLDVPKFEAATGITLKNQRSDMLVQDGVAIIEMTGVVAKKMNLFSEISGGASTQIVGNQIRAALEDPRVTSIILSIDSPGGTVDGTQELADLVYQARSVKPVVALADGMMASAAYWIGSAASQIFISSDTTAVGSIGVVATHTDMSKAEAARGVKTTEVTAGAYKRVASQYGPLSEDGRAVIQAQVDTIYSVFVDSVARNRGTDAQTVLKDMADGRVFIGQQAIDAGLVDGVSTLDALISRAAAGEFAATTQAALDGVSTTAKATSQETIMTKLTIEQVRSESPDVAKALTDEGFAAGKAEGIAAGKAEGAAGELARVTAVLALPARGQEALRTKLALDGKTTRADAAIQILEAVEGKSVQRVADLESDAAAARATAASAPDDGGPAKKPPDPAAAARAARAYKDEQARLGNNISDAEAVAHVWKGE